MRFSIATTIVIITLAAWLGWRDEERIAAAMERNARLIADAGHAGISLDPANPARHTKRHREEKTADVPALADGLLALFAKDEASRSQEERETLGELIHSLNPLEFRELLFKLRESVPLDLNSCDDSLRLAIQQFSDLFPQASLEFLAESPDIFETGNPAKINAIHSALHGWAAEAPYAALAWYRENKDKSPDFSGEEVPGFLLWGIARTDPKMAFGIVTGSEFANEKADSIIRWAAPENRLAALEGLRKYAERLEDPLAREQTVEQGLKSLSTVLSQQDFEISEKWLNSARLSQMERKLIAKNLDGFPLQPADTGHWIEWIAEALPTGEADPKIVGLVSQWAKLDYQAAADWLAATPDGPAKTTSVRTYAETVSKYEPETATQWAMTLPPGKDRDSTLKNIHRNWPKGDSAGKKAFAEEHGIK